MIGPPGAVTTMPPAEAASQERTLRPLPVRRIAAATMRSNATLIGRVDLTEAVAIVRVRPDDGPRDFVPGQYFSLGLETAGSLLKRPYSTASAPDAMDLEFLIRRVDGGAFTPALWITPVGTRVWLGRAKGTFATRAMDGRRPVFVATGTGLAPFVAMLRTEPNGPDRPGAVVVHGVAQVAELAFCAELRDLASRGRIAYLPTVSRPSGPSNAGWSGAVGRVTDTLDRAARDGLIDPTGSVAYLCGNPGMIRSATEALMNLGFPPEAIVTERYWDDPET